MRPLSACFTSLCALDHFGALQAFARVVESGSFTKTALTLHMRRTTRRVQVVPDGAVYYERVVRLLADLDDADAPVCLPHLLHRVAVCGWTCPAPWRPWSSSPRCLRSTRSTPTSSSTWA